MLFLPLLIFCIDRLCRRLACDITDGRISGQEVKTDTQSGNGHGVVVSEMY